LAPPLPVNLLQSLSPLLIVLLPPVVIGPPYRWRLAHVLGALCGAAGAALALHAHAPAGAHVGSTTTTALGLVIAAASAGDAPFDGAPSVRAIARVAPFLTADDRAALGVVDAERPALLVRAGWREGALLARLLFVDRASSAQATFSAHGAVTSSAGRFVRFPAEVARAFARRFLELGFVPRAADGFGQ